MTIQRRVRASNKSLHIYAKLYIYRDVIAWKSNTDCVTGCRDLSGRNFGRKLIFGVISFFFFQKAHSYTFDITLRSFDISLSFRLL